MYCLESKCFKNITVAQCAKSNNGDLKYWPGEDK